jgi:hypothetical protein
MEKSSCLAGPGNLLVFLFRISIYRRETRSHGKLVSRRVAISTHLRGVLTAMLPTGATSIIHLVL